MNKLKIGWAEVSITPDKRVSLAGQFAERISEYVEKPITVTAMAVDSGTDHMVMCSTDVVNVGWNVLAGVRQRLAGKCQGLDPMKVIVSAIHTHTAPVFSSQRQINKRLGKPIDSRTMLKNALPAGKQYIEKVQITENPDIITAGEYIEFLMDRIVQAVAEAWENRKTGDFVNAFGRAAVGMCRRVTYTDGSAQMWGDTNTSTFARVEGGSDTGVELLYVFDENKKLTGVVANLACPAQCVQHRLFVSPDFWGETKKLIREHFGQDIYLLALCGAAGDQCPVDLVRWIEPESDVNDPNMARVNPPKRKADPSMFDLSGMKKAGKRIANEIIEVYEEGLDPLQENPEFTHTVNHWELPLRRVTPAEAEAAREAVDRYLKEKEGDVDYNDAAKLQKHLGILCRMEVQEQMETIDVESHVIRMGSIAFATNPFELFLDYGNQIKATSPAEQTFLVQLANGSEGYLPTELAEKGGHYSAFVSSGQVGHEGGDLLVRLTLRKIRELFK